MPCGKDVAKLAHCDVSTVSRALNNTSYVHPYTKARILAAVKELSYKPNVLAQGLRKGKRHTIGVVVPRLAMTVFAEILQGIEEEARYLGYSIMVCNTEDDPEIERECLDRLRNGFIDGIIIASTGKCGRLLRDIQVSGIPIIQIIRKQEPKISSVVANYETCGYQAVKYLVEKGCKEIGLINGPMTLDTYRERYKGYSRAIREFGLKEICSEASEQTNSFEYGFHCAEELLNTNYYLDAIITSVDIQGIGAIRAIKEKNLLIPDDIKLVSLTGHSIGGMLETTMTSMEIPAHEMGKKATQMIVEEIDAKTEEKPSTQHLVFDTVLVEREST
ncbi:MAG: LacI family DNA-binding transcriptional regulator [Lachnospiraceae bacterium]|nr:LacI family DNA-binding transcriptional regulator [Lachnospiraceae bacterium]